MEFKRQFFQERFGIRDQAGKVAATIASVMLFLNWAMIIAFLVPRVGALRFLRLHYTAALGVDWVAEWWYIFSFPILGCSVFFINGYFSGILSKKHRVLGLTVLFVTATIELVLAGGGVMAVLLNS